jgi:hypothetical protein
MNCATPAINQLRHKRPQRWNFFFFKSMTSINLQHTLTSMALVTCMPKVQGSKITLEFTQTPPEDPGVYVVYLKQGNIPFYVGEAGNLRQRLTYLFRCYRTENPHPCHLRHKDVWEELPDCDQFCDTYGVRWCSTKGAFGRLEAEEALQSQFGTNAKAFYLNFVERIVINESMPSMSPISARLTTKSAPQQIFVSPPACSVSKDCGAICPVWWELTTNQAYKLPEGFIVPTMTGRRENLRFQSLQQDAVSVIRVWRVRGNLDFSFNEMECRAICQRFAQGLQEGRTFVDGGTSYFNQPLWANPPLGMIRTPFAASVIRHARQQLGLPI